MTPTTVKIKAQANIDEFDDRIRRRAQNDSSKSHVQRRPVAAGLDCHAEQKSGTIVSIYHGALAAANSGVINGVKGTAHWAILAMRAKSYAKVKWLKNVRYGADGKIASGAGISATIPTALKLATQLCVSTWGGNPYSDDVQIDFDSNRSTLEVLDVDQSWL